MIHITPNINIPVHLGGVGWDAMVCTEQYRIKLQQLLITIVNINLSSMVYNTVAP